MVDEAKQAPGGGGRQLVVLLGCGAIVLLAAGARRSLSSQARTDDAAEVPTMGPLPSGAPMRDPAPTIEDVGAGCHFADRGFGDYAPWKTVGRARVLVPTPLPLGDDGSFPLLVHFHGGEAVRRELAPEGLGIVIAAVDAGVGSNAYGKAFGDAGAFMAIVEGVEDAVAKARELPSARAWPIVLSSWSAGYAAIGQVLAQKKRPVNGLVLLDSLYASYKVGSREVEPERLGGFVAYAKAAVASDGAAMFLVHSGVPTPNYASTAEVGTYLLGALGLDTTTAAAPSGDPVGLTRSVDQGDFHLRAYATGDRDAHCAALRFLKGALRDHILHAAAR